MMQLSGIDPFEYRISVHSHTCMLCELTIYLFKFSENFFSFDASHKTIVQWISEDVQYQRSSCQFNSWIEDNRPPSIQCDTISRIELFAGVCVTRLKDTIMLHTH